MLLRCALIFHQHAESLVKLIDTLVLILVSVLTNAATVYLDLKHSTKH
jgi:hypothetical protein